MASMLPRMAHPNTIHGESHTPLHANWQKMKQRCQNPKDPKYPDYGGRGITVCSEWQDYLPFRAWALTNGYEPGLTIDRIDNDGNYESDNCRWTSLPVQARNKRNNIWITAFGETKILADWVKDPRCTAPSRGGLIRRMNRGLKGNNLIALPPNLPPTKCIRDHEFTPENTYITPTGAYQCRKCNVIRQQEYSDRKKGLT